MADKFDLDKIVEGIELHFVVHCPECGELLDDDDGFCLECGHPDFTEVPRGM